MPALNQNIYQFTEKVHGDVYPWITNAIEDSALDKTVLVTGGGRGIGKAIATKFAASGAKKVIVTARTISQLKEVKAEIESVNKSTVIIAKPLDVTDEGAVKRLFADSEVGIIDVLVNNAGRIERHVSLAESETSDWWSTFETNVKGTYMVTKEYINANIERGGTIISTSSIGSGVVTPKISSYQMTKTAVNRMMEFVDAEYETRGFRCFAFHPGAVKTTLVDNNAELITAFKFTDTPELAAATCVYLASKRSEYLKGRYISSNWDVEELESAKDNIVGNNLLRTTVVLY